MPIARASAGRFSTAPVFPLAVHASGRYLVDASGRPFLIHGDTAWSLVGQLTDAEIDQYVADRYARGVTAILFSAPEAYYTSQTPAYNNVDGVAPFGTMSPVDWTNPTEAYWARVDRVVNQCKNRGIACFINPCYLGALDADGWRLSVAATSAGDFQTYGAWLANRYTQGNVVWHLGGDYQGDNSANVTKQWNIVTGMRTVRTTDVITAHGYNEAYSYWSGQTGWNLNSTYFSEEDYQYVRGPVAYARSGPIPFFHLEGRYEQEPATPVTAAALRMQTYASYLSGSCGFFFGNNPIWHFECDGARAPFTYTGTWESNLNSTGSQQHALVKSLFAAFAWWKLVPKQDASLVSSSLSTTTTRLYPALASDGTFALVYVPSSQTVTLVMTAFSISSVRVRLYDPTTGNYSTVGTYANTGTQGIATGGERVIVCDAP